MNSIPSRLTRMAAAARNVLVQTAMKTLAVRFALTCSLAVLGGCNWGKSAHRDDHQETPGTPGEKVGQAAYKVQKGAEKAAKELQHDLKTFSHDAREGFKEEKQKDQQPGKQPEGAAAK